ncbi:MAG TPA: heme exporter protein CcmD [Woeseiaceae bacterium]
MIETLSMGGYGAYVWTAYAATFVVLAVCAVQARRRHRRIVREIRIRLKAAETAK